MMSPDPKLVAALDAGCLVVTANHRLARTLRNEYALAMRERGVSAWHTPRMPRAVRRSDIAGYFQCAPCADLRARIGYSPQNMLELLDK